MIKLADGRGLLYQWDTGRQVECDAEQVHFSNHHYGTSIDVDVKDGKATIPNQLLTSATPIKAWAWVKDSNGEYTKEEQIFLVAKRNKPSDYVYTPTEIKTWQDLQNQIGDLNNLTTAHKDNLVNAINDAAGGGSAGDITAEDVGYTLSEDVRNEFPELAELESDTVKSGLDVAMYYAIAGMFAKYIQCDVQTATGTVTFDLQTIMNSWLPALKLAHEHENKSILDLISAADGKLKYNGSDVGLKGADGTDGKDGITPTIGANGNWCLDTTDTGKPSRGEKGDTGAAGADGYTPVKGTDYWTAADKAEIVNDTLAALPTWTGGNY